MGVLQRYRRDARRRWWGPTGTGSSPVTGASSPSGSPPFLGSTGAPHLNQPVVGMATC
jgi:hypothetical protein